MFQYLIVKLKEEYLMDRSKKKQGFSTFLRGCNPFSPTQIPIGARMEQVNQSTFRALK
jgi:hypothetical protein